MPLKASIPESETKPEAPEEPPKKEKAEVKITKSKGVPSGGDDAKAPSSAGSSAESPVPLGGKKKKGLGFPLFDDIANAFSKKE